MKDDPRNILGPCWLHVKGSSKAFRGTMLRLPSGEYKFIYHDNGSFLIIDGPIKGVSVTKKKPRVNT